MTSVEGIIGLIASVFAILAGLTVACRYMAKRFDRWTEAVIENSDAIRGLIDRVATLERQITRNDNALYVRRYACRSARAQGT